MRFDRSCDGMSRFQGTNRSNRKWNNRSVFYYRENLLRRWYNSRLRYCAIGRCLKDRLPIIFRFRFVSLSYDCRCVLAVQNHQHTTEIITKFKTEWSRFPQKTQEFFYDCYVNYARDRNYTAIRLWLNRNSIDWFFKRTLVLSSMLEKSTFRIHSVGTEKKNEIQSLPRVECDIFFSPNDFSDLQKLSHDLLII